MGRKKNAELDFRFCEIPAGSSALVLPEEVWEDAYGSKDGIDRKPEVLFAGQGMSPPGHFMITFLVFMLTFLVNP